jgi:GTPase SAR1 family protein
MSEAQAEQKTGETNKGETKQNKIDDVQYEILPEDYSSFDLSFKLIVIGDSGVGKSCLTNNAIKTLLRKPTMPQLVSNFSLLT